ncbi:MAG: ABC transporter ATP-binding protein [Gammaproteobacteria bacterium]|nr:ABC transporter ATP-binding protein [Gammaproteobacteria bacterium]MYK44650.1 ABC transporter ATP-binding protein [Gammaproteobacteria bacterium]
MTERYHDRLDVRTTLATGDVFSLFRRALGYLWPQRRLFAARAGLMVLIYALGLPLPWFLKILIDHGVMQQPIPPGGEGLLYPFFMTGFLDSVVGLDPLAVTLYALTTLAVVFLFVGYSGNTMLEANLAEGADVATRSENKISAGFSAAHGLVGLLDLCLAIRLSQRITHHVRGELFSRLSRQPLTSANLQRSGDAIFRVLHDAPSIAGICYALTLNPLAMVVSVGANLWVLTAVYGGVAPELVWIGLSAVGLTLLATSPLARWARRVSQASRASGSATTDEVEEGLKNVAAVQSLGGSDRQREQFAAASRESFRQSLLLVWVVNAVEWIAEHVHLVFATAGFWVIFAGIIRGELTLGDIPVVLRMYSLLYETSMQFGRIWIDQQDNAAAARRVFFSMDHEPEQSASRPATPLLPDSALSLRFEEVGFRYPDGRRALAGISFEACAGQTLAIVGPSGAGKTTLAQMIPKFLHPTDGRVTLNGVDLAELDTAALRRAVAYVFQEHQLLTDTVAANLRIAKPEATVAEMESVCRLAGALDFVRAMPEGFESRIGRGGGALSTGQKQRLSIARGLLRGAPILILDEPTAALDPETERALLDALSVTGRDRLTIVIAHRLSTIERADRIVYLDQGRVVEAGSPAELLAKPDGAYKRFVDLQLGASAA